jgi:S1-C subfamily serine protease
MSLDDPPQEGQPLKIPWLGVVQMTGVTKELAEFLGLKHQPAAQIGDVIPDGPASDAGLQASNIIIAMNGKPLDRGDLPEEIPMILSREISRMKIGDQVTFTVMTQKGQPTHDVTVTLAERPPSISSARRYYAADLGFVAREAMFEDKYLHKVKLTDPAVVIDLVKHDGAAETAKLAREDLLMQLNGNAVTDLDEFQTDYKAFRQDHPHDAVVLVVQRQNGQEETINIEPPENGSGLGSPGLGEP